MKENEIEKHLIWVVARKGGKTWKFTSPSSRGVADRIVCLPNGVMWFVELKAPKGRLSPLQKLFAQDMEDLEQNYTCLWSKEMIDAFFA